MFMRKMAQSTELTHGMAQRLGYDLAETTRRNPEGQAIAFRAAVMRCTQCCQQEDCKQLQACNDRLERAPDYCRNTWL